MAPRSWVELTLPLLQATRVLRRERRGSSSPVVVETSEGPYVVKLRGAAQSPAALVAEVVVGGLADTIGLAVPARAIVVLEPDTPSDDPNDELADLLAASAGENLGFRHLPRAHPLHSADLAQLSPDWASQVRWLDWLVLNPDRTSANPNILFEGGRPWLIDHGAALLFHHDWGAVTEEAPLRPEPGGPHLLATIASRLEAWDPLLTELLTRERLEAILETVPDSFLLPLLPPGAAKEAMVRRRAAYVAFLWKRLRGLHTFKAMAGS